MSDIWEFAQRAAKHVLPKSEREQAAADEMERQHHHAVGLGYFTLQELAERAAAKAAEQEVDGE